MKILPLTFLILLFNSYYLIGQWTQLNGPHGGEVTCFAMKDSNIFAGTYWGGIYLSTNNGASWSPVFNGFNTSCLVNAIIVKGSNIFAVTTNGIFKSSNNGANWIPLNNGSSLNGSALSMAVQGNRIFAGTDIDGLFMSSDDGASWNLVPSAWNIRITSIVVQGSNLYESSSMPNAGINFSIDSGISWTASNAGLTNRSVNELSVVGTKILAGTDNGIYISNDSGKNWNAVDTSFAAYSFAVSGSDIFVSSWNKIYLSIDSGNTWNIINDSIAGNLAILGNNLFLGNVNGVFQSNNMANTFRSTINGFNNSFVFSLENVGSDLICGTDNGLYLTPDSGSTWTGAYNSSPNFPGALTFLKSGANLFSGAFGVYLSIDSGFHWISQSNGLPYDSTLNSYVRINCFAINGSDIYAGTDDGVYMTSNNGNNWIAINGASNQFGRVFALQIIGNEIYAGGDSGMFLSPDSGMTWLIRNHGLQNSLSTWVQPMVQSILFLGDTIFAGGNFGIVYSTDQGLNWTGSMDIHYNYGHYVTSLTSLGNVIFVGTLGAGIFISMDNGISWNTFNDRIPSTIFIEDLKVIGTDIYAASYGCGIWKRSLSNILMATNEISEIQEISIYPNPALNYFSVHFNSSADPKAKISIFNLLGKLSQEIEVKTGDDKKIDISDLPSGIYLIRIKMDDRTFIYRLIRE